MSTELLTAAVDCFWLFFGGVLVFFMQTGFTMVEAGFTRSKNTGNIIMKNIVDFMFGSIIYWLIGYGLMYGEGNGFIGIPFGDMFMNGLSAAPNMDYTALFFQTVFCATSATIVSGAVAGRTDFRAYCIYSACISLFIYPIAGHWVWGGGWLSDMGFHDFAGSAIVHMLGIQLLGALCLIVWAAVMSGMLFFILKKAGILRAKPHDEVKGLDSTEHGLPSAYPDFVKSYNENLG